ncbi:hypothetical protein Btru_039268 [Bulinus truncatus]|nr:hypothetical protein Btru_039268 [Bulinus truncatus]
MRPGLTRFKKSQPHWKMSPRRVYARPAFCAVLAVLVVVVLFKSSIKSFTLHQASKMWQIAELSRAHNSTAALISLRRKGRLTLRDVDLTALSDTELLLTLHTYLDNVDILCQRKIRLGNLGDGGWEVCDDPDVRPQPPCVIYSFGINFDFSFDDDAARVYGCHVHSFDPSMWLPDFNRSRLIHFHALGLDGEDHVTKDGWSLLTLASIRRLLGHLVTPISALKVDIEGHEWSAVPQMAESGDLVSVRQLLVEFHVNPAGRPSMLAWLTALKALEETGFRRFYAEKNPHCGHVVPGHPVMRTTCYVLYMLK